MELSVMRSLWSVLACAVCLAGCAGDGSPPSLGGTTTTMGGGGAASLAMVQQQVFTPSCVFLGCHDALTQADGLNLSNETASYDELVGELSNCASRILVTAGNADTSYLMAKVGAGSPAPCGATMPMALPALSPAQVQLIRSWIDGGALPASLNFEPATSTTTTSTTTLDLEN